MRRLHLAALGLLALVAGCAETRPAAVAMSGASVVAAPPSSPDTPPRPAVGAAAGPAAARTSGPARRTATLRPAGARQVGQASYYADSFAGRRMANGRVFDPQSNSVAHRTLPFGTRVLVTHLGTGASTTAVVEDRGPFVAGRVIDLSPRLAAHLGILRAGVARVAVTPVEVADAAD